jgi:hypothetical protein
MPRYATPWLRPTTLAAVAASTFFVLSGCDKNAADPPLPRVDNFPVAPNTPGDTSVPSASSVMTPAQVTPPVAKDSPPATQTNAPLTDKQESAAMPLGGQANDHSAPKPVEAASAASAP